MATIAPDLARVYDAVTQPDPRLLARVVAGVATVAHATLTEYADEMDADVKAWARRALGFPLSDVKPALWVVTQSAAYQRDGVAIADADILAALLLFVDVLAAPHTA